MSIMITADSKDLEIISDTILVMQYLLINPHIIPSDDQVQLTNVDIAKAYDYYIKIYDLLTTAGMTLKDYNEAMSHDFD